MHGPIAKRMADAAQTFTAKKPPTRPTLDPEALVDYLDWIGSCVGGMTAADLQAHMQVAELAVRLAMGAAQAKATQHTLVQDGVIAPPPQAS